ncbi:MAG TPA: elongation factor P, partial [Gammaproteobacteria bacterium]
SAVGEAQKWLKEQDLCQVMLWNAVPIIIMPTNFVTLKVTQTDPGVRGNTVQGGSKPAHLETGAVVNVPLFIEEGDIIRVDTRTGEYMSRAKE